MCGGFAGVPAVVFLGGVWLVGGVAGDNGTGGLVVVGAFVVGGAAIVSVETVVTLIELSSSLLLKTATTTASFHVGIVHFGAVAFGAFETVVFSTAVLTDVDGVIFVGWGEETSARSNSKLAINSAGVFLMLVLLFKKFEASVGEPW